MRLLRYFVLAAAVISAAPSGVRAALTAGGAAALDGSGNLRTTFTNVETIALRQQVFNSVASAAMIQFTFTIYNPSGGAVFHHTGNSARAVLGNSNSQIAGLAIATFYTVPGVYKFRGEAVLGTDPALVQDVSFQISSPNINLVYPPYGALGLTDKPLTFRWIASGASTYKITVADNAGLYNPLHEDTVTGAVYTYPENPTQSREQLVPNQVYYWKVYGLDSSGNKIAESTVYSFSLKALAASQSRDVAVTALVLTDTDADFSKPLHFRAVVQNTGGTNEASISIKMTLSGLPAQDSPKNIGMLNSGESREIPFTAFMPAGQTEGLAVACVDIFDDNIPDNCKTNLVTKASGSGAPAVAAAPVETRNLSYQEIWDAVVRRLGPDAAKALDGYTFDSIDCADCTAAELNDMILSLINGSAKLTGATVTGITSPPQTVSLSTQTAKKPEIEEEKDLDVEMDTEKTKDSEWGGYTTGASGAEPSFYTLTSQKAWEKVWSMLSSEKAPRVDFSQKTIIGIIAGTGNKADTVRIIARRPVGDTTVFDYYMTESAGQNTAAPYVFKTFEKVDGKVDFKRIDVGGK